MNVLLYKEYCDNAGVRSCIFLTPFWCPYFMFLRDNFQ